MPLPAITRVSNLQISSDSRNKEKGFYVDALTTAQRDAIPTIENGLLIYNTDTSTFQAYQNGAWVSLTTAPAVALYAPVSDTASAPAVANGVIYYDTDTNKLTTGVNGAYVSVYTSPLAQTGNLVMQSAAADPAGGSSVSGEVYYNTVSNVVRARINGVWNTVNTSLQTATGVGLTSGTAFTLPAGTRAAVELAGNQVLGFTYYDTTNDVVRVWAGAVPAWKTVTAA